MKKITITLVTYDRDDKTDKQSRERAGDCFVNYGWPIPNMVQIENVPDDPKILENLAP